MTDMVQRVQEASSSIRLETMCLCVPLRLGVFLCASFTFFTSFLYVCDRQYWQAAYRPFTGGFALRSQLAIGFIEYTGVLFGLLGVLGAWNIRKSHLQWYNYWQLVRLIAWIYMYTVDVPLLGTCEMWVNDIQEMTKEYGWNAIMYQTALSATCPSTRTRFFALSGLTLLGFMYIVWCTSKYVEFIGAVPKHLLRVHKDLAPGAFYAHSHGEKTSLNGTYASNVHINGGVGFAPKGMMNPMGAPAPMGAMPPGMPGMAPAGMPAMPPGMMPSYGGAGGPLVGPAVRAPVPM